MFRLLNTNRCASVLIKETEHEIKYYSSVTKNIILYIDQLCDYIVRFKINNNIKLQVRIDVHINKHHLYLLFYTRTNKIVPCLTYEIKYYKRTVPYQVGNQLIKYLEEPVRYLKLI